MRQVFTLAAIAECQEQGHAYVWRRSWHSMVFEECSRCGDSRSPQLRERHVVQPEPQAPRPADAPTLPPIVAPAVPGLTGPQRDAEISRLRFEERMPLTVIAAQFGITPQRASQICKPPTRRRSSATETP